MKTLAFILSNLLLIASLAQAQTGTAQEKEFWTTVTETTEPPQEIVTNPQAFDRDATQMTSRLESKQGEAAVWLDPALWKYEKTPSSDTADPGSVIAGMDAIRFTHKEGEIEGMLVVQDSPLSLPQILAQAYYGAAAADKMEIREEYRTVNGTQVLQLQMRGEDYGVAFASTTYYHKKEDRMLVLGVSGTRKALEKHAAEVEKFLNSLVIRD